jgi:hypothetical protein
MSMVETLDSTFQIKVSQTDLTDAIQELEI